jgi:hypothetical protein
MEYRGCMTLHDAIFIVRTLGMSVRLAREEIRIARG